MASEELNQFYNRIGKEIGWDFSQVNTTSTGVKWNFYERVKQLSKPMDTILDLGTGGGENILKLAPTVAHIDAVDQSPTMIQTARSNQQRLKIKNVTFYEMASEEVESLKQSYELVSCCHAPFSAKVVERVVSENGIFLTQQVSEGDKVNLKECFGRGQAFGVKDGTLKETYIDALKAAGIKEIFAQDYNAVEYYKSDEDLRFLLTHTPIIENFGKMEDDEKRFQTYLARYQTENGIETNSKRFMIMARK